MDMKMSESLRNTLLIGCLCVYIVESAENLRTTRIFSKRPNEYRVIRRYYDISISACETQCMYRKSCRAVIYVRKSSICKLLWRYSSNAIIEAKRTLYETGLEELHQNFSPCLGVVCADNQTCVPTDSGNACKDTECGRPPVIFTVVNGNMYSVGNTVIVSAGSPTVYTGLAGSRIRCGDAGIWHPVESPSFTNISSLGNTVIVSAGSPHVYTGLAGSKITCGHDGVWHPVDSQCFPGWKEFGNACYWLGTTAQTQAGAQTYCENVVPNAYLADIKSDAEITFVANWLQPYDRIGVWINGKYNTGDHLYYWADGTAVSSIGWAQDEPNNDDEHCMACVRFMDFHWADVPCDGIPTMPFSSMCKQHRHV